MANFSVIILTAAPPGQAAESGGAYVKIDGRESLLRCVELFLNRDNIPQIQLCFMPEALEEGKRKYGGHLSFSGVKVFSAGPRWMDQIAAAGDRIDPKATHVVVHDAARPAVSYSDIDALLDAGEKNVAATLVAPMRNALVELDEGGHPMAYHPADRFMHVLTPQVYTRERFLKMAASKTEAHASEITLVKGSPLNLRISGSGDASLMKSMIAMLPKPKVKPPSSPFEEAQW